MSRWKRLEEELVALNKLEQQKLTLTEEKSQKNNTILALEQQIASLGQLNNRLKIRRHGFEAGA